MKIENRVKQDLSIVIPFYNGENYINNLIRSLENSYAHSKRRINLDILLILDSMKSEVTLIEKQLDEILTHDFLSIIKVYKNKTNQGAAVSRNFGLKLSSANFITFIDQDDFVEENYFSVLESTIAKESYNDFYILNGFYVEEMTKKKISIFCTRPKINLKRIISQNRIKTPGLIVFKRCTLIQYSCTFIDLDPTLRGCDDWYLLIDLYFKKPELSYFFIKKKIFNYLFHGQNYSNDLRRSFLGSIKVLSYFLSLHPNMNLIIEPAINRLEFEYSFYNNNHKINTIIKNPKGLILYIFVRITDLNRLLFSSRRIFHNIPFRV